MSPHPSRSPATTPQRLFVCLWVALCAASPPMAGAQAPVARGGNEINAWAVGVPGHFCVDPSDAMARRRHQDEPCKLPLYELPRPELPMFDPPARGQANAPGSPTAEVRHAMFWRFPVQGHGPQEVPRHGWR